MEVVGESDFAVRALSGIFAVASLPLAWIAGRRLAGKAGARWALVIVALSLLTGAAEPLRATAIQLLVERRRAEAASWASAVDGLVRTLCLVAAGMIGR